MNDKTNASGTNNGDGERGCGRGEELVAYLYGEAKPEEAKRFRQHLTSCAVCRDELAAFGGVREAVADWRADVMASVPSLNIEHAFVPAAAYSTPPARKRSAVAALREFFSLSPLWLQAATVAAALLFCGLTVLTVARSEVRWDSNGVAFRTVRQQVVEKPVPVNVQTGYTQEQVDAMVAQRVNSELADRQAKWEAENNQRVNVLEAALKEQRNAARNSTVAANRQGSRRLAPGGSSRQQLADARDDQDYFSTREERAPRLTDLLVGVNTPR